MPLDAFLQQRIFKPLGMKDTCFFLAQDKASRLATVYVPQPDGQAVLNKRFSTLAYQAIAD